MLMKLTTGTFLGVITLQYCLVLGSSSYNDQAVLQNGFGSKVVKLISVFKVKNFG